MIFKERDGSYSWRKILTCIAAVVFAVSCIGFLFGAPELPGAYLAIIASVFLFYFAKDPIRNAKLK